ncbi:MAG: NUDIX hydrolase [Cyclobacteriaceae bacterium]|nr:NUDIX hydrolase [Cyclobacteriaceae bacterium]
MNYNDKNPWTRLESRVIYDNPWIKVEEDQVLKPSGKPGIYGRVHFKNKAVGIVPVDGELNTWLVGQYRYTLNEYSWEIPMGGGPLHESPLESAIRELKEETGIIASHWENILRIHTSNSVTDEEGFVFLARELFFGETEFDDTEDLLIKKVPLEEAVQLVMQNKITDALSIAGILKVAKLLKI